MGSAPCLADDLQRAPAGDFMAINDAGAMYAGRIKFWCSHHAECFHGFKRWVEKRREIGGNMDFEIVSDHQREGIVDRVVQPPNLAGSSTLLGVFAGLALGYDRIVIAGAPLLERRYKHFRMGWECEEDKLRGVVESMSGWTRKYLEGLNAA